MLWNSHDSFYFSKDVIVTLYREEEVQRSFERVQRDIKCEFRMNFCMGRDFYNMISAIIIKVLKNIEKFLKTRPKNKKKKKKFLSAYELGASAIH